MTEGTRRQATYRKTKSGEWVVFAPAEALRPGGTVLVAKKALGSVPKAEVIARVGRPFTVDGVEMAYGYLPTREEPARRVTRRAASSTEHCYYGHTAPVRGCSSCFDDFS